MKRGLLAAAIIIPTMAAATVATAVVAGVGASGSGPQACSLVGCEDGIGVLFWKPVERPDEPVYVRVCAVGRCEQARVASLRIAVDLPCPEFDGERTVNLTARVLGGHGEVASTTRKRVAIRRIEPNGAECGPTCWIGRAGFNVRKGEFVPYDQAQDAVSRRY